MPEEPVSDSYLTLNCQKSSEPMYGADDKPYTDTQYPGPKPPGVPRHQDQLHQTDMQHYQALQDPAWVIK